MISIILSWTKKEWRWILCVSLALIALSIAPLLYGYFVTPPEYVFLWIQNLSPGDNPVYYSFINQAKEGALLFKSYSTTSPSPAYIFNIVWLTMGWFASLFSLPEMISFHLIRLLLIPFAVMVAYLFCSLMFKKDAWRNIAFLFLCFSSGVGAFYAFFFDQSFQYSSIVGYYPWPMDLWVAESHFFHSLYRSPHFLLSSTLLLLIHIQLFLGFTKEKLFHIVGAGILGEILLSFHPYHLPTFLVILSLFGFFILLREGKIHWKFVGYCILFFLLLSPSVLYYIWLLKVDWVKALHATANVTLTTSLPLTVVSFGVPLLLALLGIIYLIDSKKFQLPYLYLYAWFVGSFIVMYLPLPFQRRLVQGFQFPLVIFAVVFLQFVWSHVSQEKKKQVSSVLFCFLFIYLCCFSSASIVIRDFILYSTSPVLFWDADSYVATEWIQKETPKDATFIASYLDYAYIPAFALRSVYLSHSHETPLAVEKQAFSDWFFLTNTSDEHKQIFLKENDIDYVFINSLNQSAYLQWERSTFPKEIEFFNAEEKDYLEKVFERGDVRIYKVVER